jgi:hypothetical protein
MTTNLGKETKKTFFEKIKILQLYGHVGADHLCMYTYVYINARLYLLYIYNYMHTCLC